MPRGVDQRPQTDLFCIETSNTAQFDRARRCGQKIEKVVRPESRGARQGQFQQARRDEKRGVARENFRATPDLALHHDAIDPVFGQHLAQVTSCHDARGAGPPLLVGKFRRGRCLRERPATVQGSLTSGRMEGGMLSFSPTRCLRGGVLEKIGPVWVKLTGGT